MFNPSRQDVRRFFCDAWDRHQRGAPLSPIEAIAIDWIIEHPEYHALLSSLPSALEAEFPPEAGRTNPFLHLSLHLAIAEQVSIDQPPGVRAAYEALARRRGSFHDAAHDVMDCLAESIWQSQRSGEPLSNERYLECLRAKARQSPE